MGFLMPQDDAKINQEKIRVSAREGLNKNCLICLELLTTHIGTSPDDNSDKIPAYPEENDLLKTLQAIVSILSEPSQRESAKKNITEKMGFFVRGIINGFSTFSKSGIQHYKLQKDDPVIIFKSAANILFLLNDICEKEITTGKEINFTLGDVKFIAVNLSYIFITLGKEIMQKDFLEFKKETFGITSQDPEALLKAKTIFSTFYTSLLSDFGKFGLDRKLIETKKLSLLPDAILQDLKNFVTDSAGSFPFYMEDLDNLLFRQPTSSYDSSGAASSSNLRRVVSDMSATSSARSEILTDSESPQSNLPSPLPFFNERAGVNASSPWNMLETIKDEQKKEEKQAATEEETAPSSPTGKFRKP